MNYGNINLKNFKIEELRNVLSQDIRMLNVSDFDKKLFYTISDYIDFGVTTGSENLYFDLLIYENDTDSDKPFKLRLMTKDNHKGLKNYITFILNY